VIFCIGIRTKIPDASKQREQKIVSNGGVEDTT
jgi:hypothetical protein